MTPPDDATDEQLMHRYAAGDAHAFETLYDRHGMRLWRYVFRSVRDVATADELAQDVWLRVARNAARYQPRVGTGGQPMARLSTWLFTVARHRVVDHLRETNRKLLTFAQLSKALQQELDGVHVANRRLLEEINRLKSTQRVNEPPDRAIW